METTAVIQMHSGAEVRANLRRVRHLLERARGAGAALAVLPENFACMPGSRGDRERAAEDEGAGPVQDFLAETAGRLGLWIVGGTLPLRADDGRVAAAQSGVHPDGRETHGHSLIVGPWGETLAHLARRPGMAAAALDRAAQRRLRRRFPVLDQARLVPGKA